jgi:pre-rRNA-processing protein TSR3
MNVFVLELCQDDPSKCTARKMVRMELAKSVGRRFHASDKVIVLNPFAHRTISPNDKDTSGILAVDCSWKVARSIFFKRFGGKHRRIPYLLAANPVNYAKVGMLTSLEAVAASLYILGMKERARELLSIYKWGETFEKLNFEPLEAYSNAYNESEVLKLEREFFPQLFQLNT